MDKQEATALISEKIKIAGKLYEEAREIYQQMRVKNAEIEEEIYERDGRYDYRKLLADPRYFSIDAFSSELEEVGWSSSSFHC